MLMLKHVILYLYNYYLPFTYIYYFIEINLENEAKKLLIFKNCIIFSISMLLNRT